MNRSFLAETISSIKTNKRCIKIWERCDSDTGYVCDMNIYAGKDEEQKEGTLGERVVNKLCSSINDPNVMLCFDHFAAVVCQIKKNLPQFDKKKVGKGDCQTLSSDQGIIANLWKDSKEALILANCHKDKMGSVERRQKGGTKINVPSPEAIKAYN
ncbi:unnamed protein product [Acanthoscelides obtectus]|uniref:PiggyBac transposable element-derived protein domain-containing protein n=1 Tax=Acanthoscelides obtectus TaxID=200917 RepID=A0A9P0PX96_ACAOB|nr:unnamed protein product [Acanthoscelides obtectus]CAK1643645.1 hypothetical protein AOBTE_LOCUS13618 [Acanthoscelides obtectus]